MSKSALLLASVVLLTAVGSAQVSGVVLDLGSMLPLSDARVTLQATTVKTVTDAAGLFSLPGATGAGLVVVAAKKGWFNAPVTVNAPDNGVLILMERVPLENDPTYQMPPPTQCANCHPNQHGQWLGSPMADAGINTWTYDLYDGTGTPGGLGGWVYARDSIHAAPNPGSECASCHQPETWIETPFAALEPIGSLSAGAMHGISCQVCHKIGDIDENATNFPGIWPGVVTHHRPNPAEPTHAVVYGVLGDTSFSWPGVMRPSFQPQLTAAMCAACHQDKNDPDQDFDFEEPNGVISEPTYLEWLASPYSDPTSPLAATCVDCHMPAYGATQVAQFGGYAAPARDPATIRSHRIEGTTPAFLENAVDMAMSVQTGTTSIDVSVSIANSLTGHHVPTGVTVRNMILLVEAWRDEDGARLIPTGSQVVDDLGGVGDPEQGYYAGRPGKLFAKRNHDAAGAGPVFYTEATGIASDNRIAPLATDTSSYQFLLPPGGGTVRVRARLIYRRAFRALVDAKQWTTDGHGNPLADVQAPHFGHLMELVEGAINLAAGPGAATFGSPCHGIAAGVFGSPGAGPFGLTLSGAPPLRFALVLLGLSRTSWQGVPLPFDLTAAGAPGCELLVSPDVLVPTFTDPLGGSYLPLPIAVGPYLGATIHGQWGVIAPLNAMGLVFSDGVTVSF